MNKLSLALLAVFAMVCFTGYAQENRNTQQNSNVQRRQSQPLLRNLLGNNSTSQTNTHQGMTSRQTTSRSGQVNPNSQRRQVPSGTTTTAQTSSGMVMGNAHYGTPDTSELMKASTSKDSAMEALKRIPWNSISGTDRQKIESVVSNYTLFRRLPMAGGYCNPELFDYFLIYPEAVIALWEHLGYTQITMKRTTRNQFAINDTGGTVGTIEIVYHDADTMLVYCRGAYRGPVVNRKIEGEIVLMIQTRYTKNEKDQPIVICRADSFVRVYNVGAELMGRVFSSVLGKIADSNFEQTVSFVCSISEWSEKNPVELVDRIPQLKNIHQSGKNLLYTKVKNTYEQKLSREQGNSVSYDLLPKQNQASTQTARILSKNGGTAENGQAYSSTMANTSPIRQNRGTGYSQSAEVNRTGEASREYYEKSITSSQLRENAVFQLNNDLENNEYIIPEKAVPELKNNVEDLPILSFTETSTVVLGDNNDSYNNSYNNSNNDSNISNRNKFSSPNAVATETAVPEKMVIQPVTKNKVSSAFKELSLAGDNSGMEELLSSSVPSKGTEQKKVPELKSITRDTHTVLPVMKMNTVPKNTVSKNTVPKNMVMENRVPDVVKDVVKEEVASKPIVKSEIGTGEKSQAQSALPVLKLPDGYNTNKVSQDKETTSSQSNNGWRVVR